MSVFLNFHFSSISERAISDQHQRGKERRAGRSTDLSKLHSMSGNKGSGLFPILRKLQSEAVRMKRANPQKPVAERAEDMRKLFSGLSILKEHPLNLVKGTL